MVNSEEDEFDFDDNDDFLLPDNSEFDLNPKTGSANANEHKNKKHPGNLIESSEGAESGHSELDAGNRKDDLEESQSQEDSFYFRENQNHDPSKGDENASRSGTRSNNFIGSEKLNTQSPKNIATPKRAVSNSSAVSLEFSMDDSEEKEFLSHIDMEVEAAIAGIPENSSSDSLDIWDFQVVRRTEAKRKLSLSETNGTENLASITAASVDQLMCNSAESRKSGSPNPQSLAELNTPKVLFNFSRPSLRNEPAPVPVTIATRRLVKRRFPGPAGLLPTLNPIEFTYLDSPKKNHPLSQQIKDILPKRSSPISPRNVCSSYDSQDAGSEQDQSFFDRRTWYELRNRLGLTSIETLNSSLEIMNIDWILTKAKRFPVSLKIPFLAAALQEAPELMSTQTGKFKPPCVRLVDPSGSILAVIDANFATAYTNHLNPGTGFALQNVPLLHFKRQIILTITKRNIIFMTSQTGKETEEQIKKRAAMDSSIKSTMTNGVMVTTFSEFFPDKIMDNYHQLDNLRNIALNNELEDSQSGYSGKNKSLEQRRLFVEVKNPRERENVQHSFFSKSTLTTAPVGLTNATEPFDAFGDDEEFFKALGDTDFLLDVHNSS